MKTIRLGLSLWFVHAAACSEATPVGGTDAARGADTATPMTDDAFVAPADAFVLPPSDAFAPPGADAFLSDAPAAMGRVVINEIVPDGSPDFVELHNPGSGPVTLDGFVFADADGLGPTPDPTHRSTLPAGTTIPADGYLVIAMNVEPPGTTETPIGPVSPCPVSGVSSCLQVRYGVGRTRETIVLFAPDGTTEVARVDYMGDLRGATASFCRLPNGTGDFTTCTSTPGAPNAP